MGSASSSRGAASSVIQKRGHVPAFALDERSESGFPGHGKVWLEAAAHPLHAANVGDHVACIALIGDNRVSSASGAVTPQT